MRDNQSLFVSPSWLYTCVDLMSSLQIEHVGTNYMMTELHLSRAEEAEDEEDYYVDAVHLGRSVTVLDNCK